MDFEKNPLVNDISRCQREAKRWLALVVFTLAALAIAICINAVWPSPVSREIAIVMAIASVMAITCSSFGIRQCNDHCRSVQYGLSVFEAMKTELEDTQNEKATLRKALQWFQSSCRDLLFDIEIAECEKAKLQRSFEACMGELEDTRNELASVCSTIDSILADFCQAKKNAKALQDKLDIVKHERDDLQSKLNTARRISVRRLIERNELQEQNDELRKELNEAKMDLEWSRGLHADAKEQAASLENVLKNLNEAMEKAEVDDLREKLKMVINRLSAEDLRCMTRLESFGQGLTSPPKE